MEKVYVDTGRCKGCGYCINACKKGAVHFSDKVNQKGYNIIEIEEEKCVCCGSCYRVCPDYVFEIR